MADIVISAVLLLLVGIEARALRKRAELRGSTRRDTWASLGVYLGSLLLRPLAVAISLPIFYRLFAAAPFKLPEQWWTLLAAVFVWDLFYYFFHRVHHEIQLFWAAHEAHHSSTHFNLSTGLRLEWWTPFTSILFFSPMAVLGFPPLTIVGAAGIHALYQFWLHTELIGRLGILEWVFNTPSHHRVHHSPESRYVGRNLGGMLIVWDRLFGTFAKERQRPSYGLVENIETHNPLKIGMHAYFDVLRDVWRTKGLRARWRVLIARPIAAMRPARY